MFGSLCLAGALLRSMQRDGAVAVALCLVSLPIRKDIALVPTDGAIQALRAR
jgi:hypothetical protein